MRVRLHAWEWVSVDPIDRAGTRMDELAQEPTAHQARGTRVRIKGQVDETDRERRTPGQGGASLPDKMTITFRRTDLARLGWSPTSGDRLVQLEEQDGTNVRSQSLYLVEAHNSAKDGRTAKTVVAQFEARSPRRPSREGI